MKKLLNTLYVTTQGTYLARKGLTVDVRVEKKTKVRIPIHTLAGVVCFGRVAMSPALMELCGLRNVGVSFLSERGRFFGRVQGPVSGNVLLRREQYRRADDLEATLRIGRAVVTAKIANSRTVLQRGLRDHGEKIPVPPVNDALDRMGAGLARVGTLDALDAVRGIEGETSRAYFGVFDHLIVAQKDHFSFRDRNRRPPLDRVNALLSFLYTVLSHDVSSALQAVGLDPAVGFLHRDRSGRASLALDLMEELRAVMVDRLVLSLINRQQIRGKGFVVTESGAVLMDDGTRKEVLAAYQKRKQEELTHPFLDEKIPLGLLPHVQALLLSRHLRGDLDGYPPFIWK
ncbi:MAG: type I-C CRISPR-associated endonuclease Cas1 [Candidatus Riflebacteria bacterium]|nr:type I-C CRISPR-associated endonuclease Cas1 [Candidatus Riflebacteria bacterium]